MKLIEKLLTLKRSTFDTSEYSMETYQIVLNVCIWGLNMDTVISNGWLN